MAVFDSNSKLLNHIYQKKKSDSRWGSKNSSKKKKAQEIFSSGFTANKLFPFPVFTQLR